MCFGVVSSPCLHFSIPKHTLSERLVIDNMATCLLHKLGEVSHGRHQKFSRNCEEMRPYVSVHIHPGLKQVEKRAKYIDPYGTFWRSLSGSDAGSPLRYIDQYI